MVGVLVLSSILLLLVFTYLFTGEGRGEPLNPPSIGEDVLRSFGSNVTVASVDKLLSSRWRFDGSRVLTWGRVVNLNNQRVLACLCCFQLDGKLLVETVYDDKAVTEELIGLKDGDPVVVVGTFNATLKVLYAEDIVELEPELPVCELETIRVDEAYVRRIAEILNISSPSIRYVEGLYIVNSSYPRYLQVYEASGAFFYVDFSKLGNKSYRAGVIPEKEAFLAASRLIRALREHGLPMGSLMSGDIKYSQVITYNNKTRAENSLINSVGILFKPAALGDWPVEGPGAKVIMLLGRNGELVSLYWAWRPIKGCRYYRGISELEARKAIIELYNVPKGAQLKVWLALWAEPSSVAQGVLKPYYLFTYKTTVEGAVLRSMVGRMPALIGRSKGGSQASAISVAAIVPVIVGLVLLLKGGSRRAALASLLVALSLALVFVPVAFAQPNDDALDTEVGVEWVNDYPDYKGDLWNRDDSALGFRDQLVNYLGWTSRFSFGNDEAWEQDFKYRYAPGGGKDYDFIDAVDFAYFAGHGGLSSDNLAYIWFSYSHDYQYFRSDRARWGGYAGGEHHEEADLEWIVLDACLTLLHNETHDVFERWGAAFRGLHYILGFGSIAYDWPTGQRYGFYLRIGHTVENAWYLATMETQPAGVVGAVLNAYSENADPTLDRINPYEVSPDPYPWTDLRYFYWYC